MKNKYQLWYIGYIVSLLLIFIILFADFSKIVDLGLTILFSAVLCISHVQILHNRLMINDNAYRIDIMDERNISIREKSGNIMNIITLVLLGIATIIFITFDYLIPACITGIIIAVQPIILIIVNNAIEKKM